MCGLELLKLSPLAHKVLLSRLGLLKGQGVEKMSPGLYLEQEERNTQQQRCLTLASMSHFALNGISIFSIMVTLMSSRSLLRHEGTRG